MNNTSLFGFVLAALVVLLIPGPGVLYVVTRSLIQVRILVIPITYSGFIRSPDHPNAWGVMLSV